VFEATQTQAEGAQKKKSTDPQLDEGLHVSNLAQSQNGTKYGQTIRMNSGMIIGLGVQGLLRFLHLRWDESLYVFKQMVQGNWI